MLKEELAVRGNKGKMWEPIAGSALAGASLALLRPAPGTFSLHSMKSLDSRHKTLDLQRTPSGILENPKARFFRSRIGHRELWPAGDFCDVQSTFEKPGFSLRAYF